MDKSLKNEQISLIEIAKIFLFIGTVGFGGWPSIMAMMQEYCVNRKNWLTLDEFTHGIALGQFVGPFALNASIFIGYRVRGFKGAIVSMLSFLAPSVICVIILSELYLRFHNVPSLQSALNGISPVVVALILYASFQMGKDRIKSFEPIFLFIFTIFLVVFLKIQTVTILLCALFYAFLKVFLKRAKGGSDENS